MPTQEERDLLAINTIRTLSMDAVQKANSGHPGTAMALAPVMYTLWQDYLRYDPKAPHWPNRDRFVLSIGHASMLLYSTLHLAGVIEVNEAGVPTGKEAVSLDDIKLFRQLHSKCPGHPEYRWTSGVEVTTGPLGQGVANSVGMAIAGKWLAEHYNKDGFDLFDYHVYALTGDGCMMEGISGEAASLAAHLKLDNLTWIYDSNRITIEGSTDLAFTENTAARFEAYGWNVLHIDDVNDLVRVKAAIAEAKSKKNAPTFIIAKSIIAFGSPKLAGSHKAHGEPLGLDEVIATKTALGLSTEPFFVPDGVQETFTAGVGKRGAEASAAWNAMFSEYKKLYPELGVQLETLLADDLPTGWDANLPEFPADEKGVAGRDSSAKTLNALAANIPWLIGGAADLAPSTKTTLTFPGAGDFEAGSYGGRNFHFGIREHAMAAVLNGMSTCHVRPFGAGFLIFSDYARGGIRLSAIMELPTIHVFTHDSIGVGEDGPTHQPIEQIMSLRMIPGMHVFRPGDANETVECWKSIMKLKKHPALIAVSRSPHAVLDRTKFAPASGVAKGAYILADAPNGKPAVIIMATGSEVALAAAAYDQLIAEGVAVRVVSMPCWEIFEAQDATYKASVLPPSVTARVGVEKGITLGWERYLGLTGKCVGMTTFGASAPFKELDKFFGFTVEAVVAAAKAQL